MKHGDFEHVWKRYRKARFWIYACVAVKIPHAIGSYLWYQMWLQRVPPHPSWMWEQFLFPLTIIDWTAKLFAIIFFIRWLRAVMRNAYTISPDSKLPTRLWAEVCWIIPVVNVVSPYMVLAPLLNPLNDPERRRASIELKVWAAAWALQMPPLNGIGAWLGFLLSQWAAFYPTYELILAGWTALAGVLIVKYMERVTNMQERIFAERAAQANAPNDQPSAAVSLEETNSDDVGTSETHTIDLTEPASERIETT